MLRLEFQTEAFLLQLFILLLVEAEQERLVARRLLLRLMDEQLKMLHLLVEVAAVKMHVENGFVEHLQFFDGEFLRQEPKAHRLKMDLAAQLLSCHA